MSSSNGQRYDVVISGAGMVGAALAGLLSQHDLSIAVIEPRVPKKFVETDEYDLRVSAINYASQMALDQVGVWDRIQSMRISPYENMTVWDATGDGSIHFRADEIGAPYLGYIIENSVIQSALWDVLTTQHNVDIYTGYTVEDYTNVEDDMGYSDHVSILLRSQDDGESITKIVHTSLLVGADGARSKVRELAGITLDSNAFFQKGVVATVRTEKSHQETAWQRFLPTGPLAFLPLSTGSCSIVWTLPSDMADRMLAMSDDQFKQALAEHFDHKLGDIVSVSARAAFPLISARAERYIDDRIALVGDAAHVIHPLAGQGVNLGMKDAVALSECLCRDITSIGDAKSLRRYEMARKADNVLTQKTMDGFNFLFSNTNPLLSQMRNWGLGVTDRIDVVKNTLIKQAMGLS